MRSSAAGFLSIFFLAPLATAQGTASWPKIWNLVHPNATVLIGIDVRGIRDSAIGQSIGNQFKTDGAPLPMLPGGAMLPAAAMLPGKELLNDIDRVLISSPGSKTPARAASGAKAAGAKETPPFLAIVTGHFPKAHLQAFLKGSPQTIDTVDVYRPDPKGNAAVALLDENTVLFGDLASVRSALERRSSSAPAHSPLLARAAAMAAADDFWMLVTMPPAGVRPSGSGLDALTADVTGMDFGMAFRDTFKLDLNVATKSAESAQRMAQMLTSQIQLGMAGKLNGQQAAELMRKLNITSEGKNVVFHMEATREEFERNLQALQKARMPSLAPGSGISTAITTRPAPEPGTIKVYGMEGGVREIPTETPKQD